MDDEIKQLRTEVDDLRQLLSVVINHVPIAGVLVRNEKGEWSVRPMDYGEAAHPDVHPLPALDLTPPKQ